MRKKKSLLGIIIILLLVPTILVRATKNEIDQEEVFLKKIEKNASDIVTGKILSKTSNWITTKEVRSIYTTLEIDISDTQKGSVKPNSIIKVGYWGGTVDNITIDAWANPWGHIDCDKNDIVTVYANKRDGKKTEYSAFKIITLSKALTQDKKEGLKSAASLKQIPEEARLGFAYNGRYWLTSDFPLDYNINNNTNDCTGEFDAVMAGLETWESDSLSEIEYNTPSTTDTDVIDDDDDENAIFWRESSYIENTLGWPSNTLAICYTRSGSGRITQFDIVFNDGFEWKIPPTQAEEFDVQSVATHEAGHIINLVDLYEFGSTYTMWYSTDDDDTSKCTLEVGDRAGVRYVYPDSSYPAPSVTITQPSDGGEIESPTTIVASVSGTGLSNVKYCVTSHQDGTIEKTWTTMNDMGGGTYYDYWTFSTDETWFWIVVRGETSSGQYGYDIIDAYDET